MRRLSFLLLMAACVLPLVSNPARGAKIGGFNVPDSATPLVGVRPGAVGSPSPSAYSTPAAWVYGMAMPAGLGYYQIPNDGVLLYGDSPLEFMRFESDTSVSTPSPGYPVSTVDPNLILLLYVTPSGKFWCADTAYFGFTSTMPVLLQPNLPRSGVSVIVTRYSINQQGMC
jgi:hypothetical protein